MNAEDVRTPAPPQAETITRGQRDTLVRMLRSDGGRIRISNQNTDSTVSAPTALQLCERGYAFQKDTTLYITDTGLVVAVASTGGHG